MREPEEAIEDGDRDEDEGVPRQRRLQRLRDIQEEEDEDMEDSYGGCGPTGG